MDLESCPEQISDKVFQDVHSGLPGRRRGGGTGMDGWTDGATGAGEGRMRAARRLGSSQAQPFCEKAGLKRFMRYFSRANGQREVTEGHKSSELVQV